MFIISQVFSSCNFIRVPRPLSKLMVPDTFSIPVQFESGLDLGRLFQSMTK